jgi:hypothetical protein
MSPSAHLSMKESIHEQIESVNPVIHANKLYQDLTKLPPHVFFAEVACYVRITKKYALTNNRSVIW